MKKFALCFILFLSFFLTACIEYKEKLKLNDDGSGDITFAVGLSEELFKLDKDSSQVNDFSEDKIKKDWQDKKGIEFVGSRSYAKDGNKWIEISLKFESLEALQKASDDSTSKGMIGNISLTQNENGNWVFTRKIYNSTAKEESGDDSVSSGMMKMMFGQYKWQYELTLPSKIISTNAEEENVDTETNTVKWIFNLGSLSSNKIMTVTFEKQKSTSIVYVLIGALLLIVLSVAALTLTKKKKTESV
jgi:hypothetical protein